MLKHSLAVLIALTVGTAHAEELIESACDVVAEFQGQSLVLDGQGLRMLGRSQEDLVRILAGPEVIVRAVVCWRSQAKLAEADYMVAEAGYPLFVVQDPEGNSRALLLERSGGKFTARIVAGKPWSESEERNVSRFLKSFNGKKLRQITPSGQGGAMVRPNAPSSHASGQINEALRPN